MNDSFNIWKTKSDAALYYSWEYLQELTKGKQKKKIAKLEEDEEKKRLIDRSLKRDRKTEGKRNRENDTDRQADRMKERKDTFKVSDQFSNRWFLPMYIPLPGMSSLSMYQKLEICLSLAVIFSDG